MDRDPSPADSGRARRLRCGRSPSTCRSRAMRWRGGSASSWYRGCPAMIGETIGNYRIVSLLVTGGMGEVFLAETPAIETRVAIKVLQPGISRDQDHVQRFFNEARAVSKVNHAGTVKIFDSGTFRDRAYLVMEFLDGETLGGRIARLNRMHGAQVAEIARQIAGVL